MSWTVLTDHPFAVDSPDYLVPHGAKNDDTRAPEFVEALGRLIGMRRPASEDARAPSLLDLGCAGGGLVADAADRGFVALGLEGSPVPSTLERPAWTRRPPIVLPTDVSRPFVVRASGRSFRFDAITAWEVLEHLPEDRVPSFFDNVAAHLARPGLFLASISDRPDPPWHQTLRAYDWWASAATDAGLCPARLLPLPIVEVAVRGLMPRGPRSPIRDPGFYLAARPA